MSQNNLNETVKVSRKNEENKTVEYVVYEDGKITENFTVEDLDLVISAIETEISKLGKVNTFKGAKFFENNYKVIFEDLQGFKTFEDKNDYLNDLGKTSFVKGGILFNSFDFWNWNKQRKINYKKDLINDLEELRTFEVVEDENKFTWE